MNLYSTFAKAPNALYALREECLVQ